MLERERTARVLKHRGHSLFEIETTDGMMGLFLLPNRFRNRVILYPNDFVIVRLADMTAEDFIDLEVIGTIERIINPEQGDELPDDIPQDWLPARREEADFEMGNPNHKGVFDTLDLSMLEESESSDEESFNTSDFDSGEESYCTVSD